MISHLARHANIAPWQQLAPWTPILTCSPGHPIFAPAGIGVLDAEPEDPQSDAAVAGRREHDP
ncbi:MAG TPA: hypothetical protein VLW50_07320 [Streptosporangiaceae bacterium]|nr:hypothetical protein [Streptosporangiaceae bacterium]